MQASNEEHIKFFNRILRYLKTTPRKRFDVQEDQQKGALRLGALRPIWTQIGIESLLRGTVF